MYLSHVETIFWSKSHHKCIFSEMGLENMYHDSWESDVLQIRGYLFSRDFLLQHIHKEWCTISICTPYLCVVERKYFYLCMIDSLHMYLTLMYIGITTKKLHFRSFPYAEMAQVVEILPCGKRLACYAKQYHCCWQPRDVSAAILLTRFSWTMSVSVSQRLSWASAFMCWILGGNTKVCLHFCYF